MTHDRSSPGARAPIRPPEPSDWAADARQRVAAAGVEAGSAAPDLEPLLPERYEIRETDEGRFLCCDEAPRLRVSIDREHSFSEAEARELGGRVILLDGAGRFGPLLDNSAKLYNLDHHEGCQRLFTLASCEQALLLVHSGLGLAEGDWIAYANEPDLDTVFAIWCLLNYARLTRLSVEARDILFPLLRLEGAIDANGTEFAELCGLPSQVLQDSKRQLDRLHAIEESMRSRGIWQKVDLLQYTLDILREIDAVVYKSADFSDYRRVEEVYGHVEIGDRCVAVACRDRAGIYEVERNLKKRWGDQLGVVALEREPHHYTLRRSAPLAAIDLQQAYDKLNLLDAAVDGRPPGKRWGGSDNIGGSPRPSGTRLAAREVLAALELAYRKPSAWRSLRHVVLLGTATAALLALGLIARLATPLLPPLPEIVTPGTARLAVFALIAGAACVLAARSLSERRLWLFGVRRPTGRDWLRLAPLALAGAIPAAGWIPDDLVLEPRALAVALLAIALGAAALELFFRGLTHGVVMLEFGAQSVSGPWFVSRASAVSSVLYAAFAVVASLTWIRAGAADGFGSLERLLLVAGGALLAGVGLAMIRERSLSIWPGFVIQTSGASLFAALWLWRAA
ncbi:MAG: hypothetical protein JSU66_13020 [Deltaproteobacteria bacterium]|nr:MAG: hypothetical protein JSU66_13020 [Deltaproteobacteria bacterium]